MSTTMTRLLIIHVCWIFTHILFPHGKLYYSTETTKLIISTPNMLSTFPYYYPRPTVAVFKSYNTVHIPFVQNTEPKSDTPTITSDSPMTALLWDIEWTTENETDVGYIKFDFNSDRIELQTQNQICKQIEANCWADSQTRIEEFYNGE